MNNFHWNCNWKTITEITLVSSQHTEWTSQLYSIRWSGGIDPKGDLPGGVVLECENFRLAFDALLLNTYCLLLQFMSAVWHHLISHRRISAWRRHTGKHGSSVPHERITQPTSWPYMASPTEQVARPATKRFHTSAWRPLESCCRPRTWWWNDATALAGYATTFGNSGLSSQRLMHFGLASILVKT